MDSHMKKDEFYYVDVGDYKQPYVNQIDAAMSLLDKHYLFRAKCSPYTSVKAVLKDPDYFVKILKEIDKECY